MLAASIVALMVEMLLQPSGLIEALFSIISFPIILIACLSVFSLEIAMILSLIVRRKM